MRRAQRLIISVSLGTFAAGCGHESSPVVRAPRPATAPALIQSGRAQLRLDEIAPVPRLPAPRPPATGRPPLAAVELFAQAEQELLDNHRASAIALLDRAIALDPDSFELHRDLARACLGSQPFDERSIDAFVQAAAIEPDRLDVQLDLGRQYLAEGDLPDALFRLRLAVVTTQYRNNADRCAEADLFLASALQQQGYDRAALDRYESLLQRMSQRDLSRSADPDLAFQISDKLYEQVGDLYLRQGDAEAALRAYRSALSAADKAREPADAGPYQRIVRALLALGRRDESSAAASEAVVRCHASPESVALLREACVAAGRSDDALRELKRLRDAHPGDRQVLFAYIDLLRSSGQCAAADRLLNEEARALPDDGLIVRKQAELRQADGDLKGAMTLLVKAINRRPALADDVQDLLDRLLQPADPACRASLGLAQVQSLGVGGAARSYVLYRYAARWPRRGLAAAALREAMQSRPAFAPAFRERLAQILSDSSLTPAAARREADALCADARAAGDGVLAAELEARVLIARGDADEAARRLVARTTPAALADDPELSLTLASASRDLAGDERYEHLLRAILVKDPAFSPAWIELHDFLWDKQAIASAQIVAAQWRATDPAGLAVRLCQGRDQLRLNHNQAAEVILFGLLDSFPNEPQVLSACQSLSVQTRKPDALVRRLTEALRREPAAYRAAETLAQVLFAAGRSDDARRTLESARARMADEPDALYELSGAFARIGLAEQSEQVLEEVLRLDPGNGQASNDLAFAWADQGRRLADAETLARRAVADEPDSAARLDSLGWALYKEGKFDESRRALAQAVGDDAAPADDRADPVILDHLGDALYRLHEKAAADAAWERSRARLSSAPDADAASAGEGAGDAPPDDQADLRRRLENKRRQLKAGEPVSVAPVPAAATAPAARSAQAQ